MAFDFEKEYKEFYLPKSKPEIITVPSEKWKTVIRHSVRIHERLH